MKIAYIDLNINQIQEDYALNARGYGGGACFARYAKFELNHSGNSFTIFGSEKNFENYNDEEKRLTNYIIVSNNSLSNIRNRNPLKENISNLDDFDIIVYHHDCTAINTSGLKAKLVHWSLMGDNGAQHPSTPYTLLYRPGEQARYGKGFPIVIGKYVSDTFEPNWKPGNHIFQCSRHDKHMNSIEVAKFCTENNITGIFAGPILDNYPLLNYINNQTTKYVGLVDEEYKNGWLKASDVTMYLHTWNTAFNLSAVESLAVGTPIIAPKRGCFEYLLIEGVNGYYWDGTNLKECYDKCLKLDQRKVWETAHRFSHKAMVNSFYKAFEQILNEN